MAKETRNTTPRQGRGNPGERSSGRMTGKRPSSRGRVPENVNGIRRVKKVQDEEERLLNRRPRTRKSDEAKAPSTRPARRSVDYDGRTEGPGKRRNERTRSAGTRQPSQGRTPQNRREKPFGERSETTRRPSRNTERKEFQVGGRPKREGSERFEKTFVKRDNRVRDTRPGLGRGRRRPVENDNLEPYTGEMRLNRFIANSGVCSRREADKYIETGLVTINGKIVTELGTKVLPGDEVRFDGKRLFPEKKVYLLLNKPKGFVTTTEDPNAEKTVMDLVKDACPERIYPVGRLDKNTTGLLLFTNDGELSKRLTHPSFESKKIYQVTLDNPLTKNDLQQIADGIELEDGPIAADQISYIDPEDKTEIGIEIHSGRNRIVRRIFEHLGYNVRKLDRVFYAGLTKKDLPRGKWRILSPKEVGFLKMN